MSGRAGDAADEEDDIIEEEDDGMPFLDGSGGVRIADIAGSASGITGVLPPPRSIKAPRREERDVAANVSGSSARGSSARARRQGALTQRERSNRRRRAWVAKTPE